MLNSGPIVDAIVAALRLIPDLRDAMTPAGGSGPRITAFHYRLGQENRLAQAIYTMPAPSMLVAWEGTRGGNYDGATIFKHRFGVYVRMGNAAGLSSPVGYEELWSLICNGLPTGSPVNVRYMQLQFGLDIMDTPSVEHALDEDSVDRFKGVFVIPEIGDQ